mmetsp:Transcript_10905/g.50383  ORF Transcript_10905/g.50383 Transcript_10905/m.50383 type:complete len:254 (-) Transcript_10905:303-1064(-)
MLEFQRFRCDQSGRSVVVVRAKRSKSDPYYVGPTLPPDGLIIIRKNDAYPSSRRARVSLTNRVRPPEYPGRHERHHDRGGYPEPYQLVGHLIHARQPAGVLQEHLEHVLLPRVGIRVEYLGGDDADEARVDQGEPDVRSVGHAHERDREYRRCEHHQHRLLQVVSLERAEIGGQQRPAQQELQRMPGDDRVLGRDDELRRDRARGFPHAPRRMKRVEQIEREQIEQDVREHLPSRQRREHRGSLLGPKRARSQ